MERAVDLFAAVEAFLEHAREEKYCNTAFDYLLDAAEALGEAKAHQFHSWDAPGLEPMRLRAEKALRSTFALLQAKCFPGRY